MHKFRVPLRSQANEGKYFLTHSFPLVSLNPRTSGEPAFMSVGFSLWYCCLFPKWHAYFAFCRFSVWGVFLLICFFLFFSVDWSLDLDSPSVFLNQNMFPSRLSLCAHLSVLFSQLDPDQEFCKPLKFL